MISTCSKDRYNRQILLKEFGQSAQDILSGAKVLVIGAGGLGCPALQYLAAAGIGTIGIVDHDIVELSNLQRQVLYTMEDLGKPKAEIAAFKLQAMNPEIQIHKYPVQINNLNALEIIEPYDAVIDGTDNYPTRYLVNDACVLLDKPLIYGAVLRFEGQIGVFNFSDSLTGVKTNYRDLFPEAPDLASSHSCNDVGVLGVLPGIIGTMQAAELIKILTHVGMPLSNKILSYNMLNNAFYELELSKNSKTLDSIPKNKAEFLRFNYENFCATNKSKDEIDVDFFNELLLREKLTIIDVRESNELPKVDEFPVIQIPLSRLEIDLKLIPTENKIVVFCQSGIRSLIAVKSLKVYLPNVPVFSLTGGINAWKMRKNR